MARTTDADIKNIIEVDASIAPTLDSFIEPASALVNEVCVGVEGYTEDRLKLIETWLAAHFYAQRDPRYIQEGVSGIQVSYQMKTDLALNNTHYGQMAMILDTNGGLARLNEQTTDPDTDGSSGTAKIGVYWLGK